MKKFILMIIVLFGMAGCAAPPVGTVDPYIAVAQAQRTAEAAQQEADYYGQQLTATAQAPIVAITATAAAWAMQQQYAAATQQSQQATETAAWTATAMSWTATPNATSTVVAAQAMAQQTHIANDIEINNLQVDSARSTNMLWSMSPYIVGLAALLIAVMFGVGAAMKMTKVSVPVDARGNPQPMFDVVDGTVYDALPERVQLTAPKRLNEAGRDLPKINEAARIFPRPLWEAANQWQGGNQLPYGVTADGLGLMDLNQHPHIATIGKTGSGKSRRFLRPFITFALAAGQRVVIMGKSVDFIPFEGHPNCTIVPVRELTIEQEAARYALFLKAMIEEMNRRDEYLTSARVSTWAMAGRENTLVVLDEFGNALDMMPREYAEQTLRYTRGLVKEGRKVGFNIVIASQRVKGLRDVVTQMGRAVFFVEDEQESRFAGVPGAENLQEGYFYSKFGAQRLTGAFEPSDGEISTFLQERSAKRLEPSQWIEGVTQPELPLTLRQAQGEVVPTQPKIAEVSEVQRLAEQIREQWTPSISKRGVGRLLGVTYAGGWTDKIDAVVAYLGATTTPKEAEMPAFEAVGA